MMRSGIGRLLGSRKVQRASALPRPPARWGLEELAGRLVELSGERGSSAVLTVAARLVLEAQRANEPVAWITRSDASFFPPDLDETGVDLAVLAVVRIKTGSEVAAAAAAAGRGRGAGEGIASRGERGAGDSGGKGGASSDRCPGAGRGASAAALGAADRLLRSGAFGLVILDLGTVSSLPLAAQSRLAGLAQKHASAVVCLTEKAAGASSLGSLVGLRAVAERRLIPGGEVGLCEVRVTVVKDKRRGPGWTHVESCRGPAGLR